jgi:hypothetical protein
MDKPFRRRDLLGIRNLTAEEIVGILDTAENFREINQREIKKVPTLRGKTIINLFFEASTRTRTSFELAAKRLSADAINISVSSSAVTKGETQPRRNRQRGRRRERTPDASPARRDDYPRTQKENRKLKRRNHRRHFA